MNKRLVNKRLLISVCIALAVAGIIAAAAIIILEHSPARVAEGQKIEAAHVLTERFDSLLGRAYRLNAYAAGKDCTVLFVHSDVVLDDSLVESIHFGGPIFRVEEGQGVLRFARDYGFSRIWYQDSSDRGWTGYLDDRGVVPLNLEHFTSEEIRRGNVVCGGGQR